MALALSTGTALAVPGDLDSGFSGDGKVVTSFSADVDFANAVAIQPDGKIVVAGGVASDSGFALARYNPDGTLDNGSDSTPATSFGGDGKVTTGSVADGDFAEVLAVAIQPDQKIVAAGFAYGPDGSEDFALARYNADGGLDGGFGGGDGTVVIQFASIPDSSTFNDDRAEAVGIQSDGDIVAAGYGDATHGGNAEDFAVARYDSNGALDAGFGGDGKVTRTLINVPGGDSVDIGHDLALLPGNKVLVVGSAQGSSQGQGFALAQFESDGDSDPSFDGNGIRTRNFAGSVDSLEAVVMQGDGRIVAAGKIGDSFAVARFNANGSDDNSFDGNGYIPTTFGSNAFDQVWNDVAIQDGKIVTAGLTSIGDGGDFAVGRFLSNGAVDRNFAPCFGAQRTNFGGSDGAQGLAIDGNGRLVAAGYTGTDFGLARYLTAGGAGDCVPPNTTIKGPNMTPNRRPVFRLGSSEGGSKFQCKLDGGKFKPCSASFKTPRLNPRKHTLQARAIDKAGNVDKTPAVKTFTVKKKKKKKKK